MPTKATKKVTGMIIRNRKPVLKDSVMTVSACSFSKFASFGIHLFPEVLKPYSSNCQPISGHPATNDIPFL